MCKLTINKNLKIECCTREMAFDIRKDEYICICCGKRAYTNHIDDMIKDYMYEKYKDI